MSETKRQTPAMVAMASVIDLILASGYAHGGETATEQVLIPTTNSPRFGKSGGELATFGGRTRFIKGEDRVTVGRLTTCFYKVKPEFKEASQFQTFNTKDVDKITEYLSQP